MEDNNSNNKSVGVDITQLSPHIIEIVRQINEVDQGNVSFSVKKYGGQVKTVSALKTRIVNFSGESLSQPLALFTDVLNLLPKDKKTELRINIESDCGRVKKMSVSRQDTVKVDN